MKGARRRALRTEQHRGAIGVDAVVDKDRVAALLVDALGCDALLLLADVAAVYEDWPSPAECPLQEARVSELVGRPFAAGSMGPKVESACRFAARAGRFAAIGPRESASAIARGEAGTRIRARAEQYARCSRTELARPRERGPPPPAPLAR